jgi:tRNA pseudouridine38-40 synthase
VSAQGEDPSWTSERAGGEIRRVLLLVAYDGRNYSGMVRQNGPRTVAGELEGALQQIDPEASKITVSSRTDKGVHAARQPVSFTTSRNLSSRGWVLALGQRLPPDISVVRASFVPLEFDPRRDPIYKRYTYRLFLSQVEDPFVSPFAWRIGDALNLPLMRAEAADLCGEHDFAAFRQVDDQRTETVRKLDSVAIETDAHDVRCVSIHVRGNRFLYNMVRIIAGTLVDVGRGRKEPGAVRRALVSLDRKDLGMTAPAHGLRLEHVELRDFGLDAWPPDVPTDKLMRS